MWIAEAYFSTRFHKWLVAVWNTANHHVRYLTTDKVNAEIIAQDLNSGKRA